MSILKEKFKKHIWNLPKIDGYLFSTIIFNKYPEDSAIRYGSFYSKEGEADFILLIEVYPKPKDMSEYKSEQKDITFYYGYKPEFNVVPDWTEAITTTHLNRVFTILNLTNKEDTEELLKKAVESNPVEINEELNVQYELSNNLPDMIKGWELTTMFFGFSSVNYKGEQHMVVYCQGNYRKDDDYINVEIRKGCIHALQESKLMPEGLILSHEDFENPSIRKGKVGEMNYFYSENQMDYYSVAVHDNPINKTKDLDSLYELIEATLELLKRNI